jgi:hypothetical protein
VTDLSLEHPSGVALEPPVELAHGYEAYPAAAHDPNLGQHLLVQEPARDTDRVRSLLRPEGEARRVRSSPNAHAASGGSRSWTSCTGGSHNA